MSPRPPRTRLVRIVSISAFATCVAAGAAGALGFEPVAPAEFSGYDTHAVAVSADGDAVLGNAIVDSSGYFPVYGRQRPFIWTPAASEPLGVEHWMARFLSDDGARAVGRQTLSDIYISTTRTILWDSTGIAWRSQWSRFSGYSEWPDAISPDGLSLGTHWDDQNLELDPNDDDFGGLLRRVGGDTWAVETLCEPLGFFFLRGRGRVVGIADDGATAIGFAECTSDLLWTSTSPITRVGFVRRSDGQIERIGKPVATYLADTQPEVISGDGSVVSARFEGIAGDESLVWTGAPPSVRVADLPGMIGFLPRVTHLSADGSVLLGTTEIGSVRVAFRWAGGAAEILTDPAGALAETTPVAMTPDGVTSVGIYEGISGARVYVHDPVQGTRDLALLLESKGIDLTGWTLDEVAGLSDDGRVVAGTAARDAGVRSAWRADLSSAPVPVTSAAGAAVLGVLLATVAPLRLRGRDA